MEPGAKEILPGGEPMKFPPPPGQPEKILVQPKPETPIIPVEVWKKMSEEERQKFGEEAWREQK